MPINKVWDQRKDDLLCYLYEVEKVQKWSTLAQRLASEYRVKGKTGKQCRERYRYLLEQKDDNTASILNDQINDAQIYELHKKVGNKWSTIASSMGIKNDNSVKNYFHSKLRKNLRKINQRFEQQLRGHSSHRKISQKIIPKIMEATAQKFNTESKIPQEIIDLAQEMKSQIFFLTFQSQQKQPKSLLQKFQYFDENYKKQSRKQKLKLLQSIKPLQQEMDKQIGQQGCASGTLREGEEVRLFSENVSLPENVRINFQTVQAEDSCEQYLLEEASQRGNGESQGKKEGHGDFSFDLDESIQLLNEGIIFPFEGDDEISVLI